jgi:D-glycero-beta-D-manno-heptose 1-phosphate adenylyltransferase
MWQGCKKRTMQSTFVTSHKILNQEDLAVEVRRRQSAGERGIFTNGCFDLLHLGHVRYLENARALADFLILALNSDEGVRLLKGSGRPLVAEDERAEILAALTCIDYVTIFNEPTAGSLVALLQPSIYVKGGDYAGLSSSIPDTNRLPEAKVVQEYGGKVCLIPYLPHHSTTELIAAIKRLP